MTEQEIWNLDVPVQTLDPDTLTPPAWINQNITGTDVAAICQGGCASGAYMPAVTYQQAAVIMAEHGDDVLEYIEWCLGELPAPPTGSSWSGIAVHYLSLAVEMWANGAFATLEDIDSDAVA